MLTFANGIPVARIFGGDDDGKMLFVNAELGEISTASSGDYCNDSDSEYSTDSNCESYDEDQKLKKMGFDEYECSGKMEERLKIDSRATVYICGPSGSGKTEKALRLIEPYLAFFPEKRFYLFSRTRFETDPAYEKYGMKPIQIMIDESLITNPIDITQQLKGGSLILFDDCATIQSDKLRKIIDKLVIDILEVGRKLDITTIITSHLLIGNERKVARVILNECQKWVLFPRSGSVGQARYALKEHMGLNTKQIDRIMGMKTRSVTINKEYPLYVLTEKIAYIL